MSEITSRKQEELLALSSQRKEMMDIEKTLIEQERNNGLEK